MTCRLALVAALSAVACTASLELDRFRQQASSSTTTDAAPPAAAITYSDVRFTARNMRAHVGEYFEARIVDRDNAIQARAVYVDVTTTDFTIYLRRVVPRLKPPYRIDFFADHNNTFKYEGIVGAISEKDHAWRRGIVDPPAEEDVTFDPALSRWDVNFLHDINFADIGTDPQGNPIPLADTLLPFNLRITDAGAHTNNPIETRVVDKGSGRLVALHRRGRPTESFTAQVLGVLDEETEYEVSVYADTNGDGRFSPGDASWRVTLTSTNAGIDGELNLATSPREMIETGEP